MNKIKIAQFSDMHFSPGNLVESERCLNAAVTQAIDNKVDAAVFTGDSTDHGLDAHSPAFYALQKCVKRMADHCPVLMLQGTFSHEPVGFLRNLAFVGTKHPIVVADKIGTYGLSQTQFELVQSDQSYLAIVHALPTLNKADIASMSADTVGAAAIDVGNIIAQVLESWAPANKQARLQGVPSMVISHGTVVNSLTEHGVPMAGLDHEYGVGALFAAEADVIALGHIHKHQSWTNAARGYQQTIAYPGSIGRFHYGEEGEKYWLLWNLIPQASSFEAWPTPARKTIDVFFDGPPDMEKLRKLASECVGAYVRVRYEVDEEHRSAVDRDGIKAILEQSAGVQIEGKTLIIERVRARGISTEINLAQKLVKWGQATETETGPLAQRLELLQTMEPDAIVKKFITQLPDSAVVLQNTVTA